MAAHGYVALLRGINVGGHNIIPMAALCRTFADLGLSEVRSYIQSGNVLFTTKPKDPRALEIVIERALEAAFRYEARVVVRTREQMLAIVDGLPRGWRRVDPGRRYNVVFLRHEVDEEGVVERLAPKPGIETLVYRPGVLYWTAKVGDVPRTSMVKLSRHPIYKHVTVRNLNTTKKLAALVSAP